MVGDLVTHAFTLSRPEFFLGVVVREADLNGLVGVMWCDGKKRYHSRIALKWLA
jgi:hypothetical protein